MIKTTVNLLLLIIFLNIGVSRAQYNPHLLVPFKSNNLWGWSDTLGKVIIQPKYKESSFFVNLYKDKLFAKQGNEKDGFQYVKSDGNLLFKSSLFHKSEDCSIKELISVENKDGKKAIFSFESDKLVVPEGEDVVVIYFYGDLYYALFKKNSEKTFKILDDKRKIIKTQITEFEKISINSCESLILFKDSKGRFGKLKGIELEYLSEEEYASSRKNEESNFDFPPPMEMMEAAVCILESKKNEKIEAFKSTTGKTAKEAVTYCNLKTTFFSIVENGREGVLTDLGEIIVPIKYDKVTFSTNEQGVIIKDIGKYGFLQLPVQFSIIEPKYDSPLSLEETLYGTKGEKFSIYKVKKNGNYVFVGQNGVEFFKD